jgi:hypothetical protein
MAVPWNIRGSASQLFFQDKESPQCKALLAISALPHPDRSILGAFINDAVDPQEAAQYFLRVTSIPKWQKWSATGRYDIAFFFFNQNGKLSLISVSGTPLLTISLCDLNRPWISDMNFSSPNASGFPIGRNTDHHI